MHKKHKKQNKRQPVIFRQSKRVIIRPVEEDDIPFLVRWINDPEVTIFLNQVFPQVKTGEKEWLENLHKHPDKDIVFIIMAQGQPIGIIGLHNINWVHRVATTGALIGEKDHWGQGYGTEAKMLLLDYAFNTLGLRKICSSVIAFNKRSYNYSCKCGYVEEGRRRRQFFARGKFWDEILLAVFRKDWLPLWRKFKRQNDI